MIHPIRRRLWGFMESLYSNELTADSERAETPLWITKPLLNHQQATLAAALTLEKAKCSGIAVAGLASDPIGGQFYTSHGILGDRVGSGKSLTALALMKQPPPSPHYVEYVTQPGIATDGRGIGLLRTRSQLVTHNGISLSPTTASLLIVPHALVDQWTQYIKEDTTLRVHVVKRKADAIEATFLENPDDYDVVLVSNTMWGTLKEYRKRGADTNTIRTILWSRVFIDEADSILLHNEADEIHGLFYWFISASWLNLVFCGSAYFNAVTSYAPLPETPPHIVSRVQQSVINQYFSVTGCRHRNIVRQMCGINHATTSHITTAASQISRLVLRASDEFVAQSFSVPEITHTVLRCQTPMSLRVLDSFISPELMERLHAGDVLGALETVGMPSYSEDELIEGITDSWKKELDIARRTYEFKKTLDYSSDAAKAKAIETCEAKIASIQSRITAIEERIKGAKKHACPICYAESANPAITPCCQQVFCFECICRTLRQTSSCPMCRAKISDFKTVKVLGTNEERAAKAAAAKAVPAPLGKKDTAIQWIKDHKDARILVFSSYDATFSGFNDYLSAAGISNAVLMGSQARISKLLREFKEGTHRVLFLNARNMGAGLNIDCATHVLLFHKMPQELEKQIIGRAVRLGRKAPLEVVHLLHENESRSVITHA
jgi:rubrerythrin